MFNDKNQHQQSKSGTKSCPRKFMYSHSWEQPCQKWWVSSSTPPVLLPQPHQRKWAWRAHTGNVHWSPGSGGQEAHFSRPYRSEQSEKQFKRKPRTRARLNSEIHLLYRATCARLGEIAFHIIYANKYRESNKMRKQRTIFLTKEQNKNPMKKP